MLDLGNRNPIDLTSPPGVEMTDGLAGPSARIRGWLVLHFSVSA